MSSAACVLFLLPPPVPLVPALQTLTPTLSLDVQVPSKSYKIPTVHLKEGVIAVNFSESKNFEDDIGEKASLYCPGIGKATIVLLQRNLLRLREYQAALRGPATQK